jgi:hypothetical protein
MKSHVLYWNSRITEKKDLIVFIVVEHSTVPKFVKISQRPRLPNFSSDQITSSSCLMKAKIRLSYEVISAVGAASVCSNVCTFPHQLAIADGRGGCIMRHGIS